MPPPLGVVRKTVKIGKRRDESGHAFCLKRIAAFAAQGVYPLVRNAVTLNAPDIQMSGAFSLTERIYGA